MDIRQLRTFVHIAELGSFSLAAQRLRIAQPALSRQIRLLEEELDARLFNRNSRGVSLTAVGTTFLEHAQGILRQLEKARSSVASEAKEISGHVVFGMPQSAGVILAVPLIEKFRAEHPLVTLQLIEAVGSMVHDWMTNGRLDVGVIYNPDISGQLSTQALWSEDLHLVGHANAFAPHEEVPFAIAARKELALPAMGNGLRGLVERYARHADLELNTVVEADAQRIQQELARLGLIYTILPRASVAPQIEAGTLSAARIVEPVIPRTLSLAYPADRPNAPAAVLLGDMIAKIAEELVADPTRTDFQAPAELPAPALLERQS